MSSSVVQKALKMLESENKTQDTFQNKRKGKQKSVKKRDIKKQKMDSAFDEQWRYQEKDRTEANLSYLRALQSTKVVDRDTVQKIVEHHNKKSRKQHKPELEEEKTTAFTDRDFDKFEKEYDFE